MAVVVDNWQDGPRELELSELDDAVLLQWVTNPEAAEEYLKRRYGDDQRFLLAAAYDTRHLPGKHNQKDHGHGGSVPYDAIMPGRRPPTEAESKAAARAVTATPEGKRLRRTTVAFQSKSGEVERIQQDFMTRAAGKSTGDAERDKDMDTLTSAIRHAPPSSQPLYRGLSLDKDVDVHQWVGKSQILPPSSFSSDKALAKSFKGPTLKQGRRQAVVTLSPTNRRALPIEKYGTPKYAYEREWLTAGEFKVTKVQQVRGHWQIEMEHTGVFQEAS